MRKIAWIISRIFEPVWELPLMVWLAVVYNVVPASRPEMFGLLFLFDVLVPGIFLFSLLKNKKVADWDFTNRKERERAYLFTVVCHLLGVVAAFIAGQPVLGKMLLVLWVITVLFMLINHYWKISVHAGVNALLMVFLNSIYGWKLYGWMSMVLILVLWARVKTRKHTISQVMIGAALAMAIAELGFRILGVI